MKKILAVTVVLLLSGCVTPPTNIEVQNADYGEKPSKELYESKVKAYQEGQLKDPMSAVYSFSEPRKGWCIFNSKVNFGWIVDYTLNAKIRMVATLEQSRNLRSFRITLHGIYPIFKG